MLYNFGHIAVARTEYNVPKKGQICFAWCKTLFGEILSRKLKFTVATVGAVAVMLLGSTIYFTPLKMF